MSCLGMWLLFFILYEIATLVDVLMFIKKERSITNENNSHIYVMCDVNKSQFIGWFILKISDIFWQSRTFSRFDRFGALVLQAFYLSLDTLNNKRMTDSNSTTPKTCQDCFKDNFHRHSRHVTHVQEDWALCLCSIL
jgi:hypothetical protein